MTEDFLLELRCEEIPARMQEKARADLASLFEARLKALNLPFEAIESFATPRRLALIVRGVAETTAAMTEERKGPRIDAPDAAIQGFLRTTGLTREQLVARDDGKGGQVLFAVIARPGMVAGSVLASAISHVIHAFPWPKSMRWGAASQSTESLRWVRPLQGIVALLGDKLVPIEVAGIKSGAQTVGHRFHHPGVITIGSASDYVEKLRACHVIVDGAERRAIIAVGATMAARKAGLTLIEDEGLLFENAGLTEWPVPLLGRFDPDFLSVPPEVIQLTARVNQKYFVCRDSEGKLANAFVCTANIDASDGGARIVEGNQKVLAARLSDARFFWEQDQKLELDKLSGRLAKVKYFQGLGTYEEKQRRVSFFVEQIFDKIGDREFWGVWRTSELCKVDLVSATVGEFPELQGVVGSYLLSQVESSSKFAYTLKHLYYNSQEISRFGPEPASNMLQLADRLDNVVAFAAVGIWFKGSGDPYGIRQSAQAAIAAILSSKFRIGIGDLIRYSYESLVQSAGMYRDVFAVEKLHSVSGQVREIETPIFGAGVPDDVSRNIEEFSHHGFRAKPSTLDGLRANSFVDWAVRHIQENYADQLDWIAPYSEVAPRVEALLIDRLKVQQREAGVRHDLIDAVFALGGEDDLVRLLARVHALQAFVGTEDGKNLLAGYKRAANILKKEGFDGSDVDVGGNIYEAEPAESALIEALDTAEPRADAAIEAEDFEAAMAALALLRGPIDAFFEQVTVNDSDPDKRIARLGLLARIRAAVQKVADFSKIEG